MRHVFLNTAAFMTAEGLDVTIPHLQPPKELGPTFRRAVWISTGQNECKKEGKSAVPSVDQKIFNVLCQYQELYLAEIKCLSVESLKCFFMCLLVLRHDQNVVWWGGTFHKGMTPSSVTGMSDDTSPYSYVSSHFIRKSLSEMVQS